MPNSDSRESSPTDGGSRDAVVLGYLERSEHLRRLAKALDERARHSRRGWRYSFLFHLEKLKQDAEGLAELDDPDVRQ